MNPPENQREVGQRVGLFPDVDAARRLTGSALASAQLHLEELGTQIMLAGRTGDHEAVDVFARILRLQANGALDEEVMRDA